MAHLAEVAQLSLCPITEWDEMKGKHVPPLRDACDNSFTEHLETKMAFTSRMQSLPLNPVSRE